MSPLDPKDDFQRKFGTQVSTGTAQQRSPRSSLQRRIADTGQAERLQLKETEDNESSATANASGTPEAGQQSAPVLRTWNLYEKLPVRWQNRIPADFRSMLVWPHPANLWHRWFGKHAGWRQRLGTMESFKHKVSDYSGRAWTGVSGWFRRAGQGIRVLTVKGLDHTMTASRSLWAKLPTLSRVKDKIPGLQRLSRWVENSLQQISVSVDLKIQEQAVAQLLERGVIFSRELQPEQSGRDWIQSLQQDMAGTNPQIYKDSIPVALAQQREESMLLVASKQLIPGLYPSIQQDGLDQKLRAIGFVLTAQFARKQGRNVDVACVAFANMVALSLQDPAKVIAMLELVRMKWKLFNEQVANQLTQAALLSLGQGEIGKDTYHAIIQASRSFVPSGTPPP